MACVDDPGLVVSTLFPLVFCQPLATAAVDVVKYAGRRGREAGKRSVPRRYEKKEAVEGRPLSTLVLTRAPATHAPTRAPCKRAGGGPRILYWIACGEASDRKRGRAAFGRAEHPCFRFWQQVFVGALSTLLSPAPPPPICPGRGSLVRRAAAAAHVYGRGHGQVSALYSSRIVQHPTRARLASSWMHGNRIRSPVLFEFDFSTTFSPSNRPSTGQHSPSPVAKPLFPFHPLREPQRPSHLPPAPRRRPPPIGARAPAFPRVQPLCSRPAPRARTARLGTPY